MISDTAAYALRAVLYIAQYGGNGPVRVDDVAAALDLPRNYLSKTLHLLARRRVLVSTRGPHGGFRLAEPAHRLTLHRVVSTFDPLEAHRACLLGRPECSDGNPCPVHGRWKEVGERVAAFFRETTVADVLRQPAAPGE